MGLSCDVGPGQYESYKPLTRISQSRIKDRGFSLADRSQLGKNNFSPGPGEYGKYHSSEMKTKEYLNWNMKKKIGFSVGRAIRIQTNRSDF